MMYDFRFYDSLYSLTTIKHLKPGDLIVWRFVGEVDILLLLEYDRDHIWGFTLTRKKEIEKFMIGYNKHYNALQPVSERDIVGI
jgi:hypothetical protein